MEQNTKKKNRKNNILQKGDYCRTVHILLKVKIQRKWKKRTKYKEAFAKQSFETKSKAIHKVIVTSSA